MSTSAPLGDGHGWHSHPALPAADTLLCRIEDIPDGGGRVLAFGDGEQPFRLIVLRSGDSIKAWHNRCPHFGMPLALKDEWLIVKPHESLKCNVHYARFRWQDGVCDEGDCIGDRLDAIPVTVCNGEVRLGSG
jgi:nitrite reductase/ring-hydroxylating ferredoxin subunit